MNVKFHVDHDINRLPGGRLSPPECGLCYANLTETSSVLATCLSNSDGLRLAPFVATVGRDGCVELDERLAAEVVSIRCQDCGYLLTARDRARIVRPAQTV